MWVLAPHCSQLGSLQEIYCQGFVVLILLLTHSLMTGLCLALNLCARATDSHARKFWAQLMSNQRTGY